MKALKYFLYSILFLISFILIGSFVIVRFYGDDIKAFVVQEINKNLLTKVDVEQVDFKILETFPLASVQFSNVVIYSSTNENDTLLHAAKLNCKFNLIDLYQEKYELLEIELKQGMCRLQIDKYGHENYLFWKSSDSSSTNFKVNLQQVEIHEVAFSYSDSSRIFYTDFNIQKATSKGSFSADDTDLEIKTQLKNANLVSGTFKAIDNRNLYIFAQGNIDQIKDELMLKDVTIGIGELNFGLTGTVNYQDETYIDLSVNSKETDLEKTITILPQSIQNSLADYKIKGEASINGSISGKVGPLNNPSFNISFAIKNGAFEKRNTDLVFSNSFLMGSVSNGAENKLETTQIIVENFSTQLNKSKIEGSVKIENLVKPEYVFNGSLNFQLADAIDFFEIKELTNNKGSISANLSLTGKLEQFEKYSLADFKKSTVEGQVKLQQITTNISKEQLNIDSLSGLMNLQNANFEISKLNSILNGNKLSVSGKLFNIVPYLLSEKEHLICDLAILSKSLNINNFIKESSSKDSTPFQFSERLTLYLENQYNHVKYKDIDLTDLKGDLMVKGGRLDFRNLSFKSQGGEIKGDFFLHEKNEKLAFFAKTQLLNIDINQVFKTFNNFNQKTVLAENISGLTSSDLNVSFYMDRYFNIDLASLKIDADIIIDNGELKDVKALEALSDYVDLNELKRIRFKTLRNQLSVQDCTLTIPQFEIQSSALNLSVSGKHKFNNALDYHFVILLNEILGKKVKKPKNNEFGYEEDDGLGRTKLFLKLYGTTDEPKFGYDKSELKLHLKNEVNQEKKTIKKILNEEFGLFKKDTTIKDLNTNPKPKKNPFEIEWEEGNKKKENEEEKKSEKKGKFGKFIDKIAKPNEEEYVAPIEN